MTARQNGGVTDVPHATKELLAAVSWPGGKVSFRCVDVDCDNETAQAVTEALEQLANEWHLMFIWFVGVLKSREIIQRELAESLGQDESVSIGSVHQDGATRMIRTRVKRNEVIASFSDDSFGKLHAKSFVLSVFSYWEDIIRPKIGRLLGVSVDTTESDIMGEWRLLRNWLTHPTGGGEAEQQYFSRAKTLPRLLGSQRGKPEVSVGDVFSLMEQLNSLRITVNPLSQEPLVRFVSLDPDTLAKIKRQLGPNDRILSW